MLRMPKFRVVSIVRSLGYGALAVVVAGLTVVGVRTVPEAKAGPMYPPFTHHIAMTPGASVSSVASGAGAIWAIVKPASGDLIRLAKIDPRTDNVKSWLDLPMPASQLYFGRGWLWASNGAGTRITAINALTGAVSSLHLTTGAVGSIASLGSTAYAVVAHRDEVLALTVDKGEIQTRRIHVAGGPTSIVALRGVVLPSNRSGTLEPIWVQPQQPHHAAFPVGALSSKLPVIAPAGVMSVWARSAGALEREGVGTHRHLFAVRLRPAHRPIAVVNARDGACYVAIRNFGGPSRANLFYYQSSRIAGGAPLPSQAHVGHQIRSLALDPLGGVVYVDARGQLWRWVPAGIPLR